MPAIDFPSSPTNGQVFTDGASTWVYDSAKGAWRSAPYEPGAAITSATAPTNPQNGDIWFNTEDGTTYVYYNDGNSAQWTEIRSEIARSQVGLVPVVPASVSVGSGTATVSQTGLITFTGTSSVSLNSVFSSAFQNYRLLVRLTASSADASAIFRFRSGTTDDSTSNYFQYWTFKRLTGTLQDNSGGPLTSSALFGRVSSNTWGSWSGDIFSPNLAATKHVVGAGFGADLTSSYQITNAILHNTLTVFNGMTIFAASGNLTGNIKIYGYN